MPRRSADASNKLLPQLFGSTQSGVYPSHPAPMLRGRCLGLAGDEVTVGPDPEVDTITGSHDMDERNTNRRETAT